MAEKIIDATDLQKVVFIPKTSGGGSGPTQPIPEDIKKIPVGEDEDEEEGEEEEGEEGEEGEDSDAEGEEGKGKDGKPKDGEGKESKEGEDKEGEDKEGGEKKDGEDKDGKDGDGEEKSGEDFKGGIKKGQKGGGSKTSDADFENQDIDAIKKRAQEIIDSKNSIDTSHAHCGGNSKRNDKQGKSVEDDELFNEKEKFIRETIKSIMDEEAANGRDHPMRNAGGGKAGTGKGGEGQGPRGEMIVIPERQPEFLRKMKLFAEKEYERTRSKKDTDWLYTQGFEGDIFFKDKPKVSQPKKSVYIIIDVSGSMYSNVSGTGQNILEYVVGYLPTIAKDFSGQVWWISSGVLEWTTGPKKGKPLISELTDFRGKSGSEMSKIYSYLMANSKGGGGGTTFKDEFQAMIDLRKKEKHMAPIICLTDAYIDTTVTTYEWPRGSNNIIKGKIPPNTYMMCFSSGVKYLIDNYGEDIRPGYLSFEKNIQYYNLSKENRFNVDRSTGRAIKEEDDIDF